MHNSNTKNVKFIHDIELNGDTSFCKAFNKCSHLWKKVWETNDEHEREVYFKMWQEERLLLELGYYKN